MNENILTPNEQLWPIKFDITDQESNILWALRTKYNIHQNEVFRLALIVLKNINSIDNKIFCEFDKFHTEKLLNISRKELITSINRQNKLIENKR